MSNYLVDSHCHLHDQEWFTPEQAEEFLVKAAENNVRQVIVIGTDPQDSQQAAKFAAAHPNVFWTYGIHPEYAGKLADFNDIPQLFQRLLSENSSSAFLAFTSEPSSNSKIRPVAIGEIGLDYHYEGNDRNLQIQLFQQMLQLAQDQHLPVSLHIREAFADAWPILDNFPQLTGVVHSFTGSKRELREALARDFYIGVNGLATYTTPPLPPLEKIVLETDAPFLTPVPFRGTINTPGYIRNIAEYLSEKMGVAEVNLVEQTTKNARQLFHLGDPESIPSKGV